MKYDKLREDVIKLKYIFTEHEMNPIKYDYYIYNQLKNLIEGSFRVYCEIGFKTGLHKKYLIYLRAFETAARTFIEMRGKIHSDNRKDIAVYEEAAGDYARLEEKLEPLEKELIAALDLYIDKGWPTTGEPKNEND